jgi:hypothetical protein
VQLVAVVPHRSIDPGAGVISHRGFPADAVPRVGGRDPRVPDGRAEGAPAVSNWKSPRSEHFQEKTAFGRPAFFSNQHVGVEQISVDQVASLGTGVDQVADTCFSGPADAIDTAVNGKGCPPAVNLLARVVCEPLRKASPATSGRHARAASASQPAGPTFSAP